MKGVAVFCLMSLVLVAKAEPGYTTHAGNVVADWPIALKGYFDKQVESGAITPPSERRWGEARARTSPSER